MCVQELRPEVGVTTLTRTKQYRIPGFVVTLHPAGMFRPAVIEIREHRSRKSYVIDVGRLHTQLALEEARLPLRRAPVRSPSSSPRARDGNQ